MASIAMRAGGACPYIYYICTRIL